MIQVGDLVENIKTGTIGMIVSIADEEDHITAETFYYISHGDTEDPITCVIHRHWARVRDFVPDEFPLRVIYTT